MSGTKTITNVALSNNRIAANAPAGTEVGIISVSTADGTPFSGSLQLGGPYATFFTVTATRNLYSITSVTLSNAALAASPPVGTTVGNIAVTLSDGTPFTGSLSISDTTRFTLVGTQLRTASSLTNGTSYPLTITATDLGSTNDVLSQNYQITVAVTAQVPGPLTSLASPTQTTTSITITWAPPTTGGALDNGVHQLEYKTSASSTYLAAAPAPYCTRLHGSITDAFGNTWSLNANGNPIINTNITDPSIVDVLYLVGGVIWQFNQGTLPVGPIWKRVTTTGVLSGVPTWLASAASGLSLTITNLVAATTYNVRGYATNSAGGNNANASTPINVATSSQAVPAVPTGVSATAPTSNTARVSWQTPAGIAATGYIVQYKRAVDANFTNAPSWLESINGTTCTPGVGSIVIGTTPPQTYAINTSNNTTVNGTPDGGIAVLALYWAHNAYHQNAQTQWYRYNGSPNTYTLVGTGTSGDPRNTIPADTSFVQIISGLVPATAYNFRVLAFNASGNGPASTTANATTPGSVSPGIQPPAAAVAAGFTTLAFFSGFDSPSEVTNDQSGNTIAKWYVREDIARQPGQDASRLPLKYTISNSILSLNSSIVTYNADIGTVGGVGAALSTPGAIRSGNGFGTRFKYGCFECLQKYNRTGLSGQGWIAWWSSGYQANVAMDTSNTNIELDFYEAFNGIGVGTTSTGLWNWAAIPRTDHDTFATSGWGDSSYLVDEATALTAIGNAADWFIVGSIVSFNEVSVYWNTPARRAAGTPDMTIFRVNLNQQYPVHNPSEGNFQAFFDAPRLCDIQLLLGGSDGSPYLIDYVAVWQ